MEQIKGLTKPDFLVFFNMLPKGNPEKAWIELAYAAYKHIDFVTSQPVDVKVILQKWELYAKKVKIEKTDTKYVKFR